jgi:hypothetical protein
MPRRHDALFPQIASFRFTDLRRHRFCPRQRYLQIAAKPLPAVLSSAHRVAHRPALRDAAGPPGMDFQIKPVARSILAGRFELADLRICDYGLPILFAKRAKQTKRCPSNSTLPFPFGRGRKRSTTTVPGQGKKGNI